MKSIFEQLNTLSRTQGVSLGDAPSNQSTINLYEVPFTDLYKHYKERLPGHILELKEKNPTIFQDFFIRASGSPGFQKLTNTSVAMIGDGGIGNATLEAATGLGMKDIHLIDDDSVSEVNVGPQKHKLLDIGEPKVESAKLKMLETYGTYIEPHVKRIDSYKDLVETIGKVPEVLIIGTDSMELKNKIFEDVFSIHDEYGYVHDRQSLQERAKELPQLLIIGSMSRSGFNVHALNPQFIIKCSQYALSESLRRIDNLMWEHSLWARTTDDYKNSDMAEKYEDEVKSVKDKFAALERHIDIYLKETPLDQIAHKVGHTASAFYVWKQWFDYFTNFYFPQSEGVQESCSDRASAHNNSCIGAYIVSLMQHYVINRFMHFEKDFVRFYHFNNLNSTDPNTPFKTVKSFSTSTFTEIGPTRQVNVLKKKNKELQEEATLSGMLHLGAQINPLFYNAQFPFSKNSSIRNYYLNNSSSFRAVDTYVQNTRHGFSLIETTVLTNNTLFAPYRVDSFQYFYEVITIGNPATPTKGETQDDTSWKMLFQQMFTLPLTDESSNTFMAINYEEERGTFRKNINLYNSLSPLAEGSLIASCREVTPCFVSYMFTVDHIFSKLLLPFLKIKMVQNDSLFDFRFVPVSDIVIASISMDDSNEE